jgi:ribonuclease P protein component
MLARNRRVPTALFDRIMKDGISLHSLHFSIRSLSINDLSPARIGVAVPKKVESKAVGRVKLKRVMRESVKDLLKKTDIPNGAFTPRPCF